MAVDASIPLGTNSGGFDIGKMISLADMAQQFKQRQQAAAGQNMLKQILSDPGSIDPATGRPTRNALKQITASDPAVGLQLQQEVLSAENADAQLEGRKSENAIRKITFAHEQAEPALIAYDQAIEKGMTPEQAQRVGQEQYNKGRAAVASSGLFHADELDKIPTTFNPVEILGFSERYKDYVAQKKAQKATERAEAAEKEKEKHDRALEEHALKMEGVADRRLTDAEKKDKDKADKAKAGLLSDEERTLMADQYLAGDKSVFANLGRGAQGADNIKAVRGEIAKQAAERGMSGADIAAKIAEFSGITAGERSLGTRTAQVGMAVKEAESLIPLALEASGKVNRTKYPSLNAILLAGERGTGDEDVVRLGVATNSLINVYARAISPTGTPTVSDKDHARELLSSAWGKGQYNAAIDQLQKEMTAAGKSPGAVREEFRDAVHSGSKPVSDAVPKVPASIEEIKAVSTKDEYEKLPKGAHYSKPGDEPGTYRTKQ